MQKVRPTLRALHDMGMEFPVLTQPLGEIDHPVVRKSQEIPDAHRAGSAERIRFISDCSVSNVKANSWRAAAANIACPGVVPTDAANPLSGSAWWVLAAGHRQSDTPQQDSYARLAEECARAAKHTEAPANSDALLPRRFTARALETGMSQPRHTPARELHPSPEAEAEADADADAETRRADSPGSSSPLLP